MFRLLLLTLLLYSYNEPTFSCSSKGQTNRAPPVPEVSYDARATNKSCSYGRGQIIHIGIYNATFTPKIHVCFDNTTYRTFWTKHYLGHTNATNFTSGQYWSSKFFNKFRPDDIYRRVSYNTDRGHLSPRADFDSEVERKMTYFYVNAAPQSRSLNQGSWKSLEVDVRSVANKERRPLKVITGSGGSLFSFNTFNYTYPEYFFKILVFDSGKKEVFVGVNNASVEVGLQNDFRQSLCGNVLPFCGCFGGYGGVVYCCEFDGKLMRRFGLEDADVDYEERL